MPTGDILVMLKGDVAMGEKQFSQAAKLYDDLYKRKPSPLLAHKLGQAYWAADDKENAAIVLTEAVAKYPNEIRTQYALAIVYSMSGVIIHKPLTCTSLFFN